MKAILRFILLPAAVAVGFSTSAIAEDDRGPVVHPTLELYANDAAEACAAHKLQARVTINNVTAVGILKLEIYTGDDNFLRSKGRYRSIRVPAEDGPQLVCVDLPGPGKFAIASYHDIDGDRKMKKKWNFTPREPYALSNNPDIRELRMPKFSEAAFDVTMAGADVTLNLVDLKAQKQQNDDDDADDEDDDK